MEMIHLPDYISLLAIIFILTLLAWRWVVERGESKEILKDHNTFRVVGVPLNWDVKQLQNFLADHKKATLVVKSLAQEIDSSSQSATIVFHDFPLSPKRHQNERLILPRLSDGEVTRDQYLSLDKDFLGITTLYAPSPEDHKIDVVALSGIGGHAFGSFKEKGGGHMWLRDSLPYDLISKNTGQPMARVMVYGYESGVAGSENMQNLEDLATMFHNSLITLATASARKPIILIAHSLGGLIVKQALITLSNSKNEDDYSLIQAVYGIVFFGVPHAGMDINSLLLMAADGPNRFLIESISHINSQVLTVQQRQFHGVLGDKDDSEIFCFYETLKSPTAQKDENGRWEMKGPVAVLVTKSSATHCRYWEDGPEHICAIARTHSNMVKFGPQDHEYVNVRERLKGLAQRALTVRNRSQVTKIYALPEKPEARNCLRDLFQTDPSEDRRALKRKKGDRARGTCEWILETEELAAWFGPGEAVDTANQLSHVLWLHGTPGTGKSTMAIFLTEELSRAFPGANQKTLTYFFCDSSFDTRKTATSILRGMLLQLVQQHPVLLNYFIPKYNERGADMFKSFDALWSIFMVAAADENTGQKYCIIDALDECDRESQEDLLRQLQETFQSQNAPSNIRILVTSRPYPEICEYLERFPNKDLASFSDAKQDINRFIEQRIEDLATKKHYTEKVKGRIGNILRDKAEGTFLWVGLACNELDHIPSKDAVQVLQHMPKGLHSLYRRILNTLEQKDSAQVQRILGFIAVCLRPLSVSEVSEACQLHQDEDDLETRIQFTREQIASCRLMVVIQDDKVLLLHQSVKDFLTGASAGHFINELEAHAQLAYRCIDSLIERFHESEGSNLQFLKYATENWTNHACMGRSIFEVNTSQAEFFEINSPCRENWLALYRLSQVFPKVQLQSSILHIAVLWDLPTVVDYVFRQDGDDYKLGKLIHLVDYVDDSSLTPLAYAAQSGNTRIASSLLNLGAKATSTVMRVAVESRSSKAKDFIALLLDRRADEIIIREEVMMSAAGWNNKEVMMLLLDRRGSEIMITDMVVKAAAKNEEYGEEVMRLLLDQRGNEIIVTNKVLKAAVENRVVGKEVMALLLDRRGNNITINDEVMISAAAGNSEEVMALLLDRRGNDNMIAEEIVKAAAGNYEKSKKVMALLLDRQGNKITITEEVVKTAAGNNEEVMALLLDRRGSKITITEEVVKAAAGNYEKSKEVMALLLDRRGNEVIITEGVMQTAAGNPWTSKEVMALLLDRRGSKITITEEVVKIVAGNYQQSQEVMALLLNRRGNEITITEEVVKNAARNNKEVIALLLDRRGNDIMITEEIVKAAAGNSSRSKEVMALLLDRRGSEIVITEEVMKTAAGNSRTSKEVIELLLGRRGSEIIITEEVMKTAAGNSRTSKEVIELLLGRRGSEIIITEEVMKTAAGNDKDTIALLLDQEGNKITVTEEVLKVAVGNRAAGREIMALFLEQRGNEIKITEEVLKAAAGNRVAGKEIMALLLDQQGNEIKITEEVFKAAAENYLAGEGIITLLLKQRENGITITREVAKTAITCG